ncbi:hypothetical protein MMY95_05960 [Lactiplantibacillus sp. ME-2]|uniref:hypothetical protein n=1 Tax=Lactiplantibacillus sp. ME-2 TaxID=2923377 RepID=UPI001F4BCC4F|nr:hypothetical protein [Lactiplantibacillus sp. ME-2]MCH7258835.1 hypothetical protein [Lactiplantibacillus sp. ME-2]
MKIRKTQFKGGLELRFVGCQATIATCTYRLGLRLSSDGRMNHDHRRSAAHL